MTRTTFEHDPLNLPVQAPSHLAGASGGGSLMRTLIGLVVVIALIYGIAWVLRQMRQAKLERTSGYGLQSAATIPLGPNRSLHLIRAGRELVLVGVAEQGVVPIRTYTEDEARELQLIGDDADPSSGPAAANRAAGSLLDRVREWTQR